MEFKLTGVSEEFVKEKIYPLIQDAISYLDGLGHTVELINICNVTMGYDDKIVYHVILYHLGKTSVDFDLDFMGRDFVKDSESYPGRDFEVHLSIMTHKQLNESEQKKNFEKYLVLLQDMFREDDGKGSKYGAEYDSRGDWLEKIKELGQNIVDQCKKEEEGIIGSLPIDRDKVDKYKEKRYKITTICPFSSEELRKTIRILDKNGLDDFLSNYSEYKEFLVDIRMVGSEDGE